MWIVLKLLVSLLLSARVVVPEVAAPEPTPIVQGTGEGGEIQQWVNQLRADQGLSELPWNPRLERVAVIRSQQIVTDWRHANIAELGAQQGMVDGYFGEDLARAVSLQVAWQMWLESPTHYAILVDPGWDSMAVGLTPMDDGRIAIALEFRQD